MTQTCLGFLGFALTTLPPGSIGSDELMLQIAKNFLYIEAMLTIGWAAFYCCLCNKSKLAYGHFPFIALSIMTALLFISPNLLILNILLFFIPVALARKQADIVIIMVVGTLGLPGLSVHLSAGSLDLFSWNLHSALALGGMLALCVVRGEPDQDGSAINASAVLFMLLMVFVAMRGTSPTNWLRQIAAILFSFGIPIAVIGVCLKSAVNRRAFVIALSAVGAMLAAIMTYEALVHWPLYAGAYQHLNVQLQGVTVKFRGGSMRAYGPLDEATNAGFAMVIALAASLACGMHFKQGLIRYAVPAVAMVGILAPQSRSAMIGAGIVLLGYAFYRKGPSAFAKVAAAVSPFAFIFVVRKYFGDNNLGDAQDTADYRRLLFTRGMEEFWKSPLVGDTMDHVTARMEDLRQGEGIIDFVNSYLYFSLAAGVIGFIIFCAVLFWPAARLFVQRTRFNRHTETGAFAGFCFVTMLSASVMLTFTSIPARPMIMTLAIAGAALSLKVPRRTAGQPGKAMAVGKTGDVLPTSRVV
jgi:hypothetical protein